MSSETSKDTRARKRRVPKTTKRSAISAPRPLHILEAEFEKLSGPHRRALAELAAHPEFKRQSEQRQLENQRRQVKETRKWSREVARKAARVPVGKHPLMDTHFSQSLHQVRCAIDYWSRLEIPSDQRNALHENTAFGGYLLRQVFVEALDLLALQEEHDRKETRTKHEAELAKAKAGAK